MGDLGVNMTKELGGDPLTLAPDVWYGVNEKLAVGLLHSNWGLTGFTGQGPSLCLSGDLCGDKLYRGGGLVARYELNPGLAVDGGVLFDTGGSDTLLALKVGVTGMIPPGPLMVMYAPNIFIGANKRDSGDKEQLNVPVFAAMPVNEQVMAGVQTGITGTGPLSDFGDFYSVPVAVAGIYNLAPNMAVGGAFTFANLAGQNSSADFRALNIFVKWTK